jgi:hypothetical protein
VKVRIERPSGGGGTDVVTGTARSRRGTVVRTIHLLVARLRYRIAPTFGSFTTTATGVGDPACRGFDVCGGSGSIGYSFTTLGGTLELDGEAVVHGREPRGLSAIVEYIARHGSFAGLGLLRPHTGQTAERFTQGSATCTDTAGAQPPALDALTRGASVAIRLDSQDASFADELRTRCPGPTQDDVLGRRPLALGSVPVSALAGRHLRFAVRGARTFSGQDFSGSYSGGAVLQLRRLRPKIGHSHFRVRVRRGHG